MNDPGLWASVGDWWSVVGGTVAGAAPYTDGGIVVTALVVKCVDGKRRAVFWDKRVHALRAVELPGA